MDHPVNDRSINRLSRRTALAASLGGLAMAGLAGGINVAGQATPIATPLESVMTQVQTALLITLEAKPGKEAETAAFLKSALPLVNAEPDTIAWFGIQLGPSTFGIFDAFPDDAGRQAHLSGKVAAALMEQAPDLFSSAPTIAEVDVLAFKLPG